MEVLKQWIYLGFIIGGALFLILLFISWIFIKIKRSD